VLPRQHPIPAITDYAAEELNLAHALAHHGYGFGGSVIATETALLASLASAGAPAVVRFEPS